MRSPKPKVLQPLAGQPLLFHIFEALSKAEWALNSRVKIGLVLGHGREEIESAVASSDYSKRFQIEVIEQREQKGTGHATLCAMESPWGRKLLKSQAPVLVLPGDLPLLSSDLMTQIGAPLGRAIALRLLSTRMENPQGYGRVIRKGKGPKSPVLRIVEEKDCKPLEREIREVATSIYLFQSNFLLSALKRLVPKNAQNEYYLTDVIAIAARAKKKIDTLLWEQATDLRGINDPWELALAEDLFQERLLERHARAGVRFLRPSTVYLESQVVIGEGTQIDTGVELRGRTQIGARCRIGAHVKVSDSIVGEETEVKVGSVLQESWVGGRVNLGPYAHLRPESRVEDHAKIGNFVELKKSTVGSHSSVAHLSYLGDAQVGPRVNIGCGFVTCNYDGREKNGKRKHETFIEADAFVGSDVQVIAPIRLGKGCYVASGSTLTQDVPADALAIARSKQINKEGYASRLRQEKK